jgi:5'-nucleotidase/UDP-sugar diphosphatase
LPGPSSAMKKIRFFSFFIVFFFAAAVQAAPKHLTVLHFNDLHGHLKADGVGGVKKGGAARIATIVRRIEKDNLARGWETLVLFGGDALSGTLISSEFEGAAEFDFLNMLGVDAMVIGNHEFDNGIPRFQELIRQASFPIVSANVYWRGSKDRLVPPSVLIEEDHIKVAILGLATKETLITTLPSNVADIFVTDPISEAKKEMKLLRQAAPFRIALTHLGVEEDVRLAKKVRGLSAVVGGHDHVKPDKYCRTVRRIPVCQTPAYGYYVGRLDFEIDDKKVRYLGSELIPVTAEVARDHRVARMVRSYDRRLSKKYDRVIGRAAQDFYSERGRQTDLGKIIAGAIRWKTGAEIGFINSGGIRAPLRRGPITIRDVAAVEPFPNRLVILDVSGRQLTKALEHGIKHGHGALLQVAGMTYEVTKGKPKNIQVGGSPVDPNRVYAAGTVDFLAEGGLDFKMLKTLRCRQTDTLIRDAVVDYIRNKRIIQP